MCLCERVTHPPLRGIIKEKGGDVFEEANLNPGSVCDGAGWRLCSDRNGRSRLYRISLRSRVKLL